MGKKTKSTEAKFHAVEFMRKRRDELYEEFGNDQEKFLEHLKKVRVDFEKGQEEYNKTHKIAS